MDASIPKTISILFVLLRPVPCCHLGPVSSQYGIPTIQEVVDSGDDKINKSTHNRQNSCNLKTNNSPWFEEDEQLDSKKKYIRALTFHYLEKKQERRSIFTESQLGTGPNFKFPKYQKPN